MKSEVMHKGSNPKRFVLELVGAKFYLHHEAEFHSVLISSRNDFVV